MQTSLNFEFNNRLYSSGIPIYIQPKNDNAHKLNRAMATKASDIATPVVQGKTSTSDFTNRIARFSSLSYHATVINIGSPKTNYVNINSQTTNYVNSRADNRSQTAEQRQREDEETKRSQRYAMVAIFSIVELAAAYFLGKSIASYKNVKNQLDSFKKVCKTDFSIYTTIGLSKEAGCAYAKHLQAIQTSALAILERRKSRAIGDVALRVALVASIGGLIVGGVIMAPELLAAGALATLGTAFVMAARYGYQSILGADKRDLKSINENVASLNNYELYLVESSFMNGSEWPLPPHSYNGATNLPPSYDDYTVSMQPSAPPAYVQFGDPGLEAYNYTVSRQLSAPSAPPAYVQFGDPGLEAYDLNYAREITYNNNGFHSYYENMYK